MPIFSEVQNQSKYVFHVIQFTWAKPEKIRSIQKAAGELHIFYTPRAINRTLVPILGNLFTLYKGIGFLKKYITENNIDIVMPRSTMPAFMINRIPKGKFKVVFDADGLPLEERVDFSGLSRESRQYQSLKKEENKMLQVADGVLTRSHEAIKIHLETVEYKKPEKFSVVLNGRNTDFFKPNALERENKRKELKISDQTKVFVYCGSLGPQYGWDEMITILRNYRHKNPNALFLILTGNVAFANIRIPIDLKENIIVKTVPFAEIPQYLSAADVAFAIREPKFSMKGVAPIKLGEYLLMGIPAIASIGIGDTEQILNGIPNCFIYDHQDPKRIAAAVAFVDDLGETNFEEIRKFAMPYFSIAKGADSYCNALAKLK